MITKWKETGCYLGKYTMPKGRYDSLTRSLEFEAIVEADDVNTVTMSITVCYCIDDNITRSNILTVPCYTSFEFEVDDEIKASELQPLWKRAVKNLRDKCNGTNEPSLKNIPYPPNEMVRDSVNDFLKRWNDAPQKEEGEI